MGLPKITFDIATNGLDRLASEVQKVPALIITGVTFPEGIEIGQSNQIFSVAGAEQIGITADGDNAFAHKHITDFYKQAGTGAQLWLMIVSDATTYAQMADPEESLIKKLIADAGGNIRVLGMVKKSTGTETITDGFDEDVNLGIIGAQNMAAEFANRYMPFRVLISGNSFSGVPADIINYRETDYDRVNLLIANNDGAKEASIGLELGRLASIPTQRSIARVKDAPVIDLAAYFTNGEPVESLNDAWDAMHDKGYTFFRNFPGRAGYYFTDDQTLCKPTNDFNSLARGLVMDEAVLIANDVLTEELSEEVPISQAGTIHPAIIKNWQTNIETQIEGLMVNQGKLSAVKAYIDANQNILATDLLKVRIQLQPVGYAKFIEVNIGYTTNINE